MGRPLQLHCLRDVTARLADNRSHPCKQHGCSLQARPLHGRDGHRTDSYILSLTRASLGQCVAPSCALSLPLSLVYAVPGTIRGVVSCRRWAADYLQSGVVAYLSPPFPSILTADRGQHNPRCHLCSSRRQPRRLCLHRHSLARGRGGAKGQEEGMNGPRGGSLSKRATATQGSFHGVHSEDSGHTEANSRRGLCQFIARRCSV